MPLRPWGSFSSSDPSLAMLVKPWRSASFEQDLTASIRHSIVYCVEVDILTTEPRGTVIEHLEDCCPFPVIKH